MVKLARGFKVQADRVSVGLRKQLGLRDTEPIDVASLLEYLGISLRCFSSFSDQASGSVAWLSGDGLEEFSALSLLVSDGCRLIIVNGNLSVGRWNSSVLHEVAHVLLLHSLDWISVCADKARSCDPLAELQANELAGHLLIPNPAGRYIYRSGMSDEESCSLYGVSRRMLKWRVGASGAYQMGRRVNSD